MARQRSPSFMEKVEPKWNTSIRPCVDQLCDISTNKRYRSPAGTIVVACCFGHGEVGYGYQEMPALLAAAD